MAPTTATPSRKVTPLALAFDMAVKQAGHPDLPTYLAASRAPGTGWQSYDQIATYLTGLVGQDVNRVTVKNITERTYGLPNTRYWGGHSQPRTVTREQFEQYELALVPTAADVAYVTERAAPPADETSDAGADTTEMADILSDPDTMSAIRQGEAELADLDGDKRYRFADGTDDPEA